MIPAHTRADEGAGEILGEGVADPEGDRQRHDGEHGKEPVDGDEVVVGQKVGGVAIGRGGIGVEQPAHMGVDEALDARRRAAVRGVGIAGLIAVAVMATVVGDPGDERALDGHGARGGEGDLEHAVGLEAAVGEEAVVADRYSVPGDGVEDDPDDQVTQMDATPPQQGQGDAESDPRTGDEGRGDGDPAGPPPGTFGHRGRRKRRRRQVWRRVGNEERHDGPRAPMGWSVPLPTTPLAAGPEDTPQRGGVTSNGRGVRSARYAPATQLLAGQTTHRRMSG